jgi:hypothetical protein
MSSRCPWRPQIDTKSRSPQSAASRAQTPRLQVQERRPLSFASQIRVIHPSAVVIAHSSGGTLPSGTEISKARPIPLHQNCRPAQSPARSVHFKHRLEPGTTPNDSAFLSCRTPGPPLLRNQPSAESESAPSVDSTQNTTYLRPVSCSKRCSEVGTPCRAAALR